MQVVQRPPYVSRSFPQPPQRVFRAMPKRLTFRCDAPDRTATIRLRSGRRESNPRPLGWQPNALPLSYARRNAFRRSRPGRWAQPQLAIIEPVRRRTSPPPNRSERARGFEPRSTRMETWRLTVRPCSRDTPEPRRGIEPPTNCLQNSCSTVELPRRDESGDEVIRTPIVGMQSRRPAVRRRPRETRAGARGLEPPKCRIWNPVPWPLDDAPTTSAGPTGFEPALSGVTSQRGQPLPHDPTPGWARAGSLPLARRSSLSVDWRRREGSNPKPFQAHAR